MSNIKRHDICFSFSKAPSYLEINDLKRKVNEKEKFLYSLKEEVGHKVLKEKIMADIMQKKITSLKEKFAQIIPLLFGKGKDI